VCQHAFAAEGLREREAGREAAQQRGRDRRPAAGPPLAALPSISLALTAAE
jgi:hypothetical protein